MIGTLLVTTGCGNDEGASGSPAAWADRHGESVAALGRELMAADAALDAGDRRAILGACNLLNDALAVVQEDALPVPDPVVNEELSEALVDIGFAVESCLAGGRSAAAVDIEAAMALVDDARESLARARVALANLS